MGLTHLQQILKSLCFKTHWKYAVFWKLKHRARMMLTLEDAYYDNHEQNDLQPHMRFQDTLEKRDGRFLRDPLGLAVANMSYLVYSLGEGIIGQVAVTGKHQWIFADRPTSRFWSSSEYCDGWKTQFSAGIKTVAVVPVVPHGVVQLGSLNTVIEDTKLVTYIKDVFYSLQNSSMEFIPCPIQYPKNSSVCMSGVSTKSSGSEILNNYPHGSNSALFNKCADIQSHLHPSLAVCNDLPSDDLTLPSFRQKNVAEVVSENLGCYSTTLRDNESMDSLQPKFVSPGLENQKQVLVKSRNREHCGEEDSGLTDMFIYSKPDNPYFGNFTHPCNKFGMDYPFLPPNILDSATGNNIEFDKVPLIQNQNGQLSSMHTQLEKALALKSKTEASCIDTAQTSMNFSAGSELHEALGPIFKKRNDSCAWSESEMTETTVSKHPERMSESLFSIECGRDYLLEAVVANAYTNSSNTRSDTSLCKSAELIITSGKTQQAPDRIQHGGSIVSQILKSSLHVEDESHQHLSSIWDPSNVCKVGSSKESSSKILSANNQQSEMQREPAKITRKRARPGESCRPRPRDRQLIQDRVKELRDLVPNGSKCSIDSLLERTIKHMLFLQSMNKHADKLKKCTESKVLGSRMGVLGPCSHERGSSWAVEVGNQTEVCPIVVENLNMNGQMLVKMLCEESRDFLEIAEAIRGLDLTILKGATEVHGEKTWACFVTEGENNKGMHRMDVLWSLMQLLQPKTAP